MATFAQGGLFDSSSEKDQALNQVYRFAMVCFQRGCTKSEVDMMIERARAHATDFTAWIERQKARNE